MLNWEKFWYIQSVLANCNGLFLIFKTFFTFPWSWLATLTSANLLGVLFGGPKSFFTPLLYETPLLFFLQLVCFFFREKIRVVFVAEGLNAVSVVFASLACLRHGYADDGVFGSRGLFNLALRACFNGGSMQMLMVSFAGEEWWKLEIVIHVVSGIGLVYCGAVYRLIHLRLRRRRLAAEQMIDQILQHLRAVQAERIAQV